MKESGETIVAEDSPRVRHELDTREAFDSVAAAYRGPLGNNALVQHMRGHLWSTVEQVARPGSKLLDLGCGTGLDAIHFAKNGFVVTGIDLSPQMLAETRKEACQAGVGTRVSATQLSVRNLSELTGEQFDCIYSDLGALNCENDLPSLAANCEALLAPNGSLVFSIIGRYCPWDFAYYGIRGDFKRAALRFARKPVPVSLNSRVVWTRYFSPREFSRAFRPLFRRRNCRALNLFLPPPYLIAWYERHPKFTTVLAWLDAKLGGLPGFNWAGDHFLIVLTHNSLCARRDE
jgi:SAM-dependent methyltransferase